MKTFKITLRATAGRSVDDNTTAEETIQSEFLGRGADTLEVSNTAVDEFKSRYTTAKSLDNNLIGCADLEDFEITAIIVEPYNEED